MNERTKKARGAFAAAAALLSLLLLLTACGGSSGGGQNADSGSAGGSNAGGASEKPLEVSIMAILLTPTAPTDDNKIKQAIEKATNSKMKINWVSGNNYTDKLNVTLASGDIPDLIFINDPFSSVFRSAVAQGAFWDIGPYIKDYPNLTSKISQTAWDLTKMADGKNYGVPRPRPSEADSFFIIRKDWLDKLGLQVPTTTDELYNVMKVFTDKDPDGNGKNDTVGLTAYINPTDMGSLGQVEQSFTGVDGEWKLQDGKLVYTALLPETRTALEYLAKVYKENLIPEDVASMKLTQSQDLFDSGKAGILVDKSGTSSDHYNKLKTVDPNFKQIDFYPLTSINGYNPKGPGFSGLMAIPKSVPEAKMKRILKMMDTWMNDDVFQYQQYGFEGTDYKVVNGEKVIDEEQLQKDNGPTFNQIVYVADPYASSTKIFFPKEVNELYTKIQDERAKSSVADISTGLNSDTAVRALPEIEKQVQDLKTKIIIGREPITAWDSFVNQLKNNPDMIKMSQEMTDAYQKRNAGQ
ncbi:extracellular solute-binding protein [Paenibacillus humicola]|uniref:extracellular solute-binding protein n=1 Tax=Paenibacillus humicola TaxID=3110540 RepID=UPI00237A6D3B|nr:extracellular solute-binding protein [Paenibacillus humicola]